jgi:L-serine dehydratase
LEHIALSLSVLEIFKMGIGPSSFHTMRPMNAARAFAQGGASRGLPTCTTRVCVHLYGSLALTGRGHCTDRAILLGLEGHTPDTLEPSTIDSTLDRIRVNQRLRLAGVHEIDFVEATDVLWHRDQSLPLHPDGMGIGALEKQGTLSLSDKYYSLGGGFIVRADELAGTASATMNQTGKDMSSIYKETSQGGLAVNVPEC